MFRIIQVNKMELGLYKHYKGNMYDVIGVARHSETLEELVVYKATYQKDEENLWVRPIAMFTEIIIIDGVEKMEPLESYGVKINSIGFMTSPEQPVPWRGPMATKAINEIIGKTHWGELDYMILDLPPGTGDIHLSIVANLPITGAVIVTTPQNVALSDTMRGISMFRMPTINVPVLGIVENMAYFTPAELPNNKYYIFGKDGGKNLAERAGVPLLAQIPLVQSICEAADAGRPAVLQENTPQALAFMELAKAVAQQIAITNVPQITAQV